jgi:tetratricopeptide (TPR) repeat protein
MAAPATDVTLPPTPEPGNARTAVGVCGSLQTLHPNLHPIGKKPRDLKKGESEFQRGVMLSEKGDHLGAGQAYAAAISADPYHGLAYLYAAESHLYTDDDHEAMRALLEHAVELLPENPRAHLRYGEYFAEIGKKPDATAEWRCALELREDLVDARVHLGRLLLENGDAELAEKELRTALASATNDVQVHLLLGDVLETEKKFNEAAVEVLIAARSSAKPAALYRRAGHLFEAAGNLLAAKKARKQADVLDPPPKARNLRPLLKRQKKT